MKYITFNKAMQSSPMDWCHQHLPIAFLLPPLHIIPTLCSIHRDAAHDYLTITFSSTKQFGLTVTCYREYNRKQRQCASAVIFYSQQEGNTTGNKQCALSAVIFYSQQEGNTTGNKHSMPRVLSYSTVSRRGIQQETNTVCLECCHIQQSAGGEYNTKLTQRASSAVIFYSR